jgi:arylsulfatase A-like enzyme
VEVGPPAVEPRTTILESSVSPWCILVLAAWFGLVGGALDLGMIFIRRDVFHTSLYYEQGRNFRWVVPLANLMTMMALGLCVAFVSRLRPGKISSRTAAWSFATLAIWGPLSRLPLYGLATLLLAAGAARPISAWFARRDSGLQRFARYSLPVFLTLLGATAVITCRRQARAESETVARLPAQPAGARNVVLIVMDTVRAQNMGLYGYARNTTPRLSTWARRGIRFDQALAPAPWTLPSHCSFMTGQWPSTLGAHWQPTLDRAYPTLAEFLASRGYLTAGFAANTYWCSYESGMDRGFAHYEDYPLTPRSILGSTVPGRWILESLFRPVDFSSAKWIRSQSRWAGEINRSFLNWLTREGQTGRPFFAFLNYIDAHEPFLPPEGDEVPFGRRPESADDYKMLLEYWDRDKLKLTERDVVLAQDAYDDCIAALDHQVGALLDELERRGLLRDTLVMITADHGEQFGEHGVFNHGFSLYAQEVRVPLLIISDGAPAGLSIREPVSLRDLPATVVDLTGLGSGSTFPGSSLAECWRAAPEAGGSARVSRAVSEVDIPFVIGPERGRGPDQRGFTMSMVSEGMHYLVNIRGAEELYDMAADPHETRNLKDDPAKKQALDRCRQSLAEFVRDNRVRTGAAADYQKEIMKALDGRLPRPPI